MQIENSEISLKYKWNLQFIFKNHQAWKVVLKECYCLGKQVILLGSKFINADEFCHFKAAETKLSQKLFRLASYLNLLNLDLTNAKLISMKQNLMHYCQQLNTDLAFLDPKVKKIGWPKIKSWIQAQKELAPYHYPYELFFKQARHVLDTKTEQLISKLGLSRQFCSDIYEKLVYADKRTPTVNYQNRQQELTPKLYTEIMENTPVVKFQKFRRQTNRIYNNEFITKKHSLAATYEAVLQRSWENAQIRGFKSVLASFLVDDEVPVQVYHHLIQQAKKHAYLVRDYFKLHHQHIGISKYLSSDSRIRLAPTQSTLYDVETAQRIIEQSLVRLGLEYKKQLLRAWQPGLIDYFPATHKQQGAYSSGGGEIKPIILLNWDQSLNSVNTLAHEVGHSVHTLFSSQTQPYPLYEYPIILAEVASTLNEQFLFEHLISQAKTRTVKIDLLQKRIEDMIGTFFRQVMLADFEYQTHQLIARRQPVTATLLADLFQKISCDYGYDIFQRTGDDLKFSWTRVSHLFQCPFYVYKYATSIAVACFFADQIKTKGPEQFISFLKAGGHKPPLKILSDYRVDLLNPVLYQAFFQQLATLTAQLRSFLADEQNRLKS